MASKDSTRSATVSSTQPDATEDRSRTWEKAPGGKSSNVATRRRGKNGEMACRGEARVAVDGLECSCGDPVTTVRRQRQEWGSRAEGDAMQQDTYKEAIHSRQ